MDVRRPCGGVILQCVDIGDGCHWNDLRRAAENHGVRLQQITQQIEAANPERLAGIVGNAPWADRERHIARAVFASGGLPHYAQGRRPPSCRRLGSAGLRCPRSGLLMGATPRGHGRTEHYGRAGTGRPERGSGYLGL